MATPEETLSALRTKIASATAAHARAQVEHDNAVAAQQKALESLRGYGISSVEEAREKLASLDAALTEELSAVADALSGAES